MTETKQYEQERPGNTPINNPHLQDSSSKLIFGDNILSSQFLRDYADVAILRQIRPEDLTAFDRLPKEQLDNILKDTPEYLLETLAKVLRALLYRMEQPEETVENTVSKIKERKMGMLFEHLEINFAEEQRKTEEAQKRAEAAERKAESAQRETKAVQIEKEIYKHIAHMLQRGHSNEEISESLVHQFSLSLEQAKEKLTE